MSSWSDPEHSLVLRSYFVNDRDENGFANHQSIGDITNDVIVSPDGLSQLLESFYAVGDHLASLATPNENPDAGVPELLGHLNPEVVDIASVARVIGGLFASSVEGRNASELADSINVAAEGSYAVAIATASVAAVTARALGEDVEELTARVFDSVAVIAPVEKASLFEHYTDTFNPASLMFSIEPIIRLDSEYQEHNIEAIRSKSFLGTDDSNISFAEMSRSLSAFCWAINISVDMHRTESFVYDFSLIGTEHIERTARSWGIKDSALLISTVEEIMRGLGTVFKSDEREYSYVIPALNSPEYSHFRYVFNVAMGAIATAHVRLLGDNFGVDRETVYGESRRIIKEVVENGRQALSTR